MSLFHTVMLNVSMMKYLINSYVIGSCDTMGRSICLMYDASLFIDIGKASDLDNKLCTMFMTNKVYSIFYSTMKLKRSWQTVYFGQNTVCPGIPICNTLASRF